MCGIAIDLELTRHEAGTMKPEYNKATAAPALGMGMCGEFRRSLAICKLVNFLRDWDTLERSAYSQRTFITLRKPVGHIEEVVHIIN